MAADLAELLDEIIARGFTRDFSYDVRGADKPLSLNQFHIIESMPFDGGTDPGDDATLFLIESTSGEKGYVVISDSFHTDPFKARFISALLAQSARRVTKGSTLK